jgi:predicted nucleotidyltransferase component of viral defense system
MAEDFLGLSADERTEALKVAASNSGRPLHILEKDVWVVWSLSALFEAPFGKHLVFKGGTSLSKAYKAIQRFSEDIDVTYDIRVIAQDLVQGAGDEPLPKNSSQRKKWSDEIRKHRLPKWLTETVAPYLQDQLNDSKLDAQARVENESVFVEYAPKSTGYGYVAPYIRIEFGARSTGEPAEDHQVTCDAAAFLTDLSFPTASPRVMRVERTIWEKMTAIHVFCLQGDIQARLARHWYDVAKLDSAGYVDSALEDRDIAQRVAKHKTWFFAERDSDGKPISYDAAVGGGLALVPKDKKTRQSLANDYAKMIEDGLFPGDPESFEWIIDRCSGIEKKANAAA